MTAFLNHTILLFAESKSGWDNFLHFYNDYLNYPGFEAWRFFNLTLFVLIMVYLVRKPLSNAFKTKRETIRAELIKAEEERQAALSQLTRAEARLVGVENESANIASRAREEADAEKSRIVEQTEFETKKLREQTENEIERQAKQTRMQLRRLSAEESVRRAEEKIRQKINADSDARLVKASIESIGGLN